MNNNLNDLSIRGGGLLGGFFKWVIGPIAILVLPVILVCGWATKTDLSYLITIAELIIGIFLGTGILIDIISFLTFHLTLKANGDFSVSNSVKSDEDVINIHHITRVGMYGGQCRLYENQEPVYEWITKPISLKNMQKFLKRLLEINPRIELDDKCAEIAKEGKDKKYQRAFLTKSSVYLLVGITSVLWFPTLEVIVLRLFLGEFTWFQNALLGNIYMTLVLPFVGTFVLGAIIQASELKWLSEAGQKRFKTSGGIAVGVLAIAAILYFHGVTLLDFLEGPAVIKNQFPAIQGVKYSRDNKDMIRFTFPAVSHKEWSVECYESDTDKVCALLKKPVNLYYSRRLEYMVRVEDATGKSAYIYNRK